MLQFKKHHGLLIPFDNSAAEYLAGLKPSDVRAYIPQEKTKDPLLHRKFHKMIHIAYESQAEITGRANFRKHLYLAVGFSDPYDLGDRVVSVARSTKGLSQQRLRALFLELYHYINATYGDVIPEEFTERFF
jgi:hypothetical protein